MEGELMKSATVRPQADESGSLCGNPNIEVTQLLQQWKEGDRSAFDRLIEQVYRRLRRIADEALGRDWGNNSVEPTDLVHEAYLRLLTARSVDWKNRAHFFGVVGRLMRQILVDRARRRAASKRGGDVLKVSLESDVVDLEGFNGHSIDMMALDLAVQELARQDEDLGRLIELRFFVGMTVDETAHILGVSPRTVKREWQFARAWLRRRLSN